MTLRTRCLALILLITAAWLDGLPARAGVLKPPARPFACEQEFVLLSVEFRLDVLEKIESSQVVTLDFQPAISELNAPFVLSARPQEITPRLFCSTDICYLTMSLQC
jgi:hypothetical protein